MLHKPEHYASLLIWPWHAFIEVYIPQNSILSIKAHRLHSSAFFWGLPYTILNIHHKTELLLLMIYILHYLKDPKLWELRYILIDG